jgi:hypothetical protein
MVHLSGAPRIDPRKGSMLFFEKKNQKTFALAHGAASGISRQ